MPARERRKGAVAERDVAKLLASMGIKAERSARNGVTAGEDVMHALTGCRIEVKRRERTDIPGWWNKLTDEAKAEGKTPMLVHRRSRQDWLVTMRLVDIVTVAEAIASAYGRPIYPGGRGDGCEGASDESQ